MRFFNRTLRTALFLSFAVLWVIALPRVALATQLHPPEEGFWVHQFGHIAFAVSMAGLVYWLRARGLVRIRGWRLIQYSAVLFVLWNLDALLVHFLDQTVEGVFQIVAAGGWDQRLEPLENNNFLTLVYYFGRMDHLLCVPAIVLLYFGLNNLLDQPKGTEPGKEGTA